MTHVEFDINWIEILKYVSVFIAGALIVAYVFIKMLSGPWM